MKLGFISDTHNQHEKLNIPNDLDLLFHCGDITGRGSFEELAAFDDWCSRLYLPKERIVVIAGNHDKGLQDNKNILNNCTYIEDEVYEIDGLKVYGSPWTPTFGMWAFMVDRGTERMKRYRQNIPTGVDILLSHGPAYGVLDMTQDGVRAGCDDLREELCRIDAGVFACGHIHEGASKHFMMFQDTLCLNASVVDENYRIRRDCTEVFYNNGMFTI